MGLFRARYQIYLYSRTWKAKRRRIIDRAKGICEKCLKEKISHVHHLTYEHIYEELDEDLIGLCKECHKKIHESD